MLVARLKAYNRREIRLKIKGDKKEFEYKGVTYHINPAAIYSYKLFGIFTVFCIDYVEGKNEPIPFYDTDFFDKPIAHKNLDTISMVVNRWLQGRFLHFQLIMLILAIITVCLVGINIVVSYIRV